MIQHRLRLRIAEASVVLHHLRAVRRQHQAEVDDSLEGTAFCLHGFHGGQEDLLHAALCNLRRVIGGGGEGAHAAGVGPFVAVIGTLVILRGGHGGKVFSICKTKYSDLRADHTFFDDHRQAGSAELAAFHHVPHGLLGFLNSLRHSDALAQGQAVRLDHDGGTLLVNVGQSLCLIGEGLVLCSGDVVLGHQLLGKGFAGLDDGGVLVGAEGLDAGGLHGVHHAQS